MNIRRRSLTDSLQLLVDTICNLFGSIVIISLLMMTILPSTAPARKRRNILTELSEGWEYVSTFKPIRNVLLLLTVVSLVGVPYTDAEIARAADDVKGKTEQDALIAYLQSLGLALK